MKMMEVPQCSVSGPTAILTVINVVLQLNHGILLYKLEEFGAVAQFF